MLTLSGKIVVNVEASYIETYLRKKGYVRTEEQKAKRVEYWVNDLIVQKELDVQEFEDFLYEELFFGKRKCIRILSFRFSEQDQESEGLGFKFKSCIWTK